MVYEKHLNLLNSINKNVDEFVVFRFKADLQGNTEFLYISPAVEALFGVKPQEVYDNPSLISRKVYPEDYVRYKKMQMECINKKKGMVFEGRIYNPDGSIRWSRIISKPVEFFDEYIIWEGIEYVITKEKEAQLSLEREKEKLKEALTRLEEKQDSIHYLSFHDQLTGLYNRRYFEQEMKNRDNLIHHPLSIVYLDVNGLKLINDSFGHLKGDELLYNLASIVNKTCRADDMAARISGDEFVILLSRTHEKDAKAFAKRIQRQLYQERVQNIRISASVGYSTRRDISESLKGLMEVAEKRMYRNKLIYSPKIKRQILEEIMETLKARNPWEQSHGRNTGEIAESIGRIIGLDERYQRQLNLAGQYHDIGKIAIEEEVLDDRGIFTKTDYENVKKHVEVGYQLLKYSDDEDYLAIANVVLYHHERWDGKGYPKGLKAEEIPLMSRILSLADAYETITSAYSYGKQFSKEEALEELRVSASSQLDPKLVEAFIEHEELFLDKKA